MRSPLPAHLHRARVAGPHPPVGPVHRADALHPAFWHPPGREVQPDHGKPGQRQLLRRLRHEDPSGRNVHPGNPVCRRPPGPGPHHPRRPGNGGVLVGAAAVGTPDPAAGRPGHPAHRDRRRVRSTRKSDRLGSRRHWPGHGGGSPEGPPALGLLPLAVEGKELPVAPCRAPGPGAAGKAGPDLLPAGAVSRDGRRRRRLHPRSFRYPPTGGRRRLHAGSPHR